MSVHPAGEKIMMKSIGVWTTLSRLAASIRGMARKPHRPSSKKPQRQSCIELEAWQQRCYDLVRENERLKYEARESRAQLCQLRIDGGAYGDHLHKRIGYMVGTFIPEGVLGKLRKHPERIEEFKRHVVDAMVNSSINAMLHVNEQGKQAAMVFLPAGSKGAGRANLPVFETAKDFQMVMPEKLKDEIQTMLAEQAKDERRKLLQY